MKPEPIYAAPSRELTHDEVWMLRTSAAGGAHVVPLRGASAWALGRRLVKLGLGEIEGKGFVIGEAGLAIVANL